MRKNKAFIHIIVSSILLLISFFIPESYPAVSIVICLLGLLPVGLEIFASALRNLFIGRVLDENLLMSLAAVGAFAIGEYHEAVAVMLFYQVGELFQARAIHHSRASIKALMGLRPDKATVLRNGEPEVVSPRKVSVGETILVTVGERIPLDGIVRSGDSYLDTSALTGEPVPRAVHPGEPALSGCINTSAVLTIEVTKPFAESTVNRILTLVQDAAANKSRPENFITSFAKWYTPIVVICALLLALIPPLAPGQPLSVWLYRGLTFLVVSCPCALVVSIPLSFFGGIGGASKIGVLVKGGNYLEALAVADTLVLDKTGTLTKGTFSLRKIVPVTPGTEQTLLETAAYAEAFSTHPIAASIRSAYGSEIDASRLTDCEEIAGHGVAVTYNGERIRAGNRRFMKLHGLPAEEPLLTGSVVHIAVGDRYLGYLHIDDEIRSDSQKTLASLCSCGIKHTVMLTGDRTATGKAIGEQLGIDEIHTELLPEDKVTAMKDILERHSSGGVLYVGDGINDAPVLALADIGVAMGALGSDAAIEAADVVLMKDSLASLPTAIGIARKTLRIAKQNIAFALTVKIGVLLLSACGFATMWAAVFADVGVCVLAILNAFRALKV